MSDWHKIAYRLGRRGGTTLAVYEWLPTEAFATAARRHAIWSYYDLGYSRHQRRTAGLTWRLVFTNQDMTDTKEVVGYGWVFGDIRPYVENIIPKIYRRYPDVKGWKFVTLYGRDGDHWRAIAGKLLRPS